MTKLDFSFDDLPQLTEDQWENMREEVREFFDDEGGLKPLGKAVYLARLGLPVFPCRPDDNSPLISGGHHGATRDEKQVRALWRKYPHARAGIPNGNASGLAVLDVDVKHGKDGFATLKKLFPAEVLASWAKTH